MMCRDNILLYVDDGRANFLSAMSDKMFVRDNAWFVKDFSWDDRS